MWITAIGLSLVLSVLAWRVARGRPEHTPVAAFVTAILVSDVVRQGLAIYVFAPYRAAHPGGVPFAGLARVAFHVEEYGSLAWPFGLAALAAAVLLGSRGRRIAVGVLVAHVAATGALSLAYPTIRGAALSSVYFGAYAAAATVVCASLVAWWRSHERPSITLGSVAVLGIVDLGSLMQWAPFTRGWDWQASIHLVAYGTLAFLHVGELLWSSSPRSKSA